MQSEQYQPWYPDQREIESSNIYKNITELGLESYEDFYRWSIEHRPAFWEHTVKALGIKLHKTYTRILNVAEGVENPQWLEGSRLNIVDSCFQSQPESIAVIYQSNDGALAHVTKKELDDLVNRVANGLQDLGLIKGDLIAIDMPMTLEAVAIYMAGIKAGLVMVTIADSFSPEEIAMRLKIAKPKLIFTQDVIQRRNKQLKLYNKVKAATDLPCIVIPAGKQNPQLAGEDRLWESFLSANTVYQAISCQPYDPITILFSSGTTGAPKAIPWDHTTPIKAASDGYYHHDIRPGDVVCWPTNLGWMMGPWLVFAALINGGTLALYADAPHQEEFGKFVEMAKITMLGTVPSLVAQWKASGKMEAYDWSAIRCFSSTGECSNPHDMAYLMQLGGHKPIIEYCGGTEVGGGYVTGTMVQPAYPATFTTPALGTEFVLLDQSGNESDIGEVFLIPPTMGFSNRLLNRDHHQVYYEGTPYYQGRVTRRHGDQLQKLENHYFRALGRIDDSMNLGGIKISAVEIEEVVNGLNFVRESAAIAVPPSGGGPNLLVVYLVNDLEIPFEQAFEEVKSTIAVRINPLFKLSDLRVVSELPRTASNKVMRRKLKEAYLSSQ
jgi:acetyl-CoA synthetase